MLRKKTMQRLSNYLYLFASYVRFPTDHRSEMSPVVVYVLVIETKGGDEGGGGGERRLSIHYVTSHPLTKRKKKTRVNIRTPLGVFNCLSYESEKKQ